MAGSNRVDRGRALCQADAMRAVLILLLIALASPATACRLALAMGFDVSRSVDALDYRVQMDGIVAALYDREVRDLILRPSQPVALALFEWGGANEHWVIVDWVMPRSEAEIDTLVVALLTHQRRFGGLTAVGRALENGADMLARAPACDWRTLDIAGDGQSNDGPDPREVYAARNFEGITVNALAIGGHESTIRGYFEREVIRGPGAFAIYTPTHAGFADAFVVKLRRELREPTIGLLD